MHPAAYSWCKMIANSIPAPKRILDIGSRDINGNCRTLFPGSEYLGLDMSDDLPGVDIVANGATWPGDGKPFDVVICTEVLEHAPLAPEICANAWHLLRGGGLFIATAASPPRAPHSALDGGPLRPDEFYRNVDRNDMKAWLSMFAFWLINTETPADIYALAVRLP